MTDGIGKLRSNRSQVFQTQDIIGSKPRAEARTWYLANRDPSANDDPEDIKLFDFPREPKDPPPTQILAYSGIRLVRIGLPYKRKTSIRCL